MIFIDTSPSLSHHGVQGMKWGIRNDETRAKYAKGSSIKGRILRRAANKAELDPLDLEKHGYKNEAKGVRKVAQKNREKAKAADIKKNQIKATKGLSTGQKAFFGGFAAVGGLIVGSVLYANFSKNGKRALAKSKAFDARMHMSLDEAFKAALEDTKLTDDYLFDLAQKYISK